MLGEVLDAANQPAFASSINATSGVVRFRSQTHLVRSTQHASARDSSGQR